VFGIKLSRRTGFLELVNQEAQFVSMIVCDLLVCWHTSFATAGLPVSSHRQANEFVPIPQVYYLLESSILAMTHSVL